MEINKSEGQAKSTSLLLIGVSVVSIILFFLPWFSNASGSFADIFKFGGNYTLFGLSKSNIFTSEFIKGFAAEDMPLVMLGYVAIIIAYLMTLYNLVMFIIDIVRQPRKQTSIQKGYTSFNFLMALPIFTIAVLFIIRLTMGDEFKYLYRLSFYPILLFAVGAVSRFYLMRSYEKEIIGSATFEVKDVKKIVCSNCGKKYDSDGARCPHCGIKNEHMIYWTCECGAENSEKTILCDQCHTYRL